MLISYNKLWKLLIDKGLNKTNLREQTKLSTNAIAKLGKNKAVSMSTLKSICTFLSCSIEDIMEFTSEEIKNDRIE